MTIIKQIWTISNNLKKDLFDDDFLKQFKTCDELISFLKEIQKRDIRKCLYC